MSKKITTIITLILCVLGFVVLFIPSLDMSRYQVLVEAVTVSLLPIIISVGANSAVEKIVNKKKDNNECVDKNQKLH